MLCPVRLRDLVGPFQLCMGLGSGRPIVEEMEKGCVEGQKWE